MFGHNCKIDQMRIVGSRSNPLDPSWSEWTLVVCTKCKKLHEWQHHSEEQMHGGDLEITATPTALYVQRFYDLTPHEVDEILAGYRTPRRFDRYRQAYVNDSS